MKARIFSIFCAFLVSIVGVSALTTDEARNLCVKENNALLGAIVAWDTSSYQTIVDRYDIAPNVVGTNLEAKYDMQRRAKTIIVIAGESQEVITPKTNSGTITSKQAISSIVFCLDKTEGGKNSKSASKPSLTTESAQAVQAKIQSNPEAPVEVPEFSTLAIGMLVLSAVALIFYRRQ